MPPVEDCVRDYLCVVCVCVCVCVCVLFVCLFVCLFFCYPATGAATDTPSVEILKPEAGLRRYSYFDLSKISVS